MTLIVLTFGSEASLPAVLDSAKGLANRVLVVDSYSTDRTEEIARAHGAEFIQHPFENYSAQRRWAEAHAQVPKGEWILHLDADEVLSAELAQSIRRVLEQNDPGIDGYLMRRLSYFWGRPIRYGHMNPSWHLRLYRSGKGRCEDRLYDQHYVVDGKTAKLDGPLLDLQMVDLTGWTNSHNRWASAEAAEAAAKADHEAKDQLKANLFGDRRERKRWLKNRVWYRLPIGFRSFAFFFYSFFLKRGFLDGKTGFVYHVLHAFWFRFLVDAKILEKRTLPPWFAEGPTKEWLRAQGAAGVDEPTTRS